MTRARLMGMTAVLLTGMGLGGCSGITDPPGASRAPTFAPRGRAPDLVSGLVPDGTIMSMVDEVDGVRYTLDMGARSITRGSDGMVLELTESQTTDAATAFSGAVQNDPSIPGLEAVAALGGAPSGGCTGTGLDYCLASVGTDLMRMEPLTKLVGKHKGKPPRIRRVLPAPGGITASMFGDPCTNIINAALPKVIQYRGYRSGFLRRGFEYSMEKATDGIVSRLLPPGSDWAISFSEAIANYFTAGVAVGWLAGNWTTYGCRDASVVAGPYYHSGGTYSMTPVGSSYECRYETWQISWDGGATWESINVRVCQFMS